MPRPATRLDDPNSLIPDFSIRLNEERTQLWFEATNLRPSTYWTKYGVQRLAEQLSIIASTMT